MDMCYQCNIVHDESKCPLCEAKEKIEALEEQLDNAQDEIKGLQEDIEDLKEDLGVNK
ncbi:hypothetical protein ACN9J3_10190 [Aliarcobacter butzleri]|uniref:hypothetical protein n=1 Tax=Aliarcobacter butzleri TaxID=28197 RepID=UPI003B2137D9